MNDSNPTESGEICKKIARECIAVRVRLLNRVITSIYDEAMRPFGFTVNQLNTLVAMSRLGPEKAKQLIRVLQMDASTLSRNLKRMNDMGWIRYAPGDDARSRRLVVTAKGRKVIEKAFPAWQEAQRKAELILGTNLIAVNQLASGIWSGQTPRG